MYALDVFVPVTTTHTGYTPPYLLRQAAFNEREEFVDVRGLKGNTWSDIFYHLLPCGWTEQTETVTFSRERKNLYGII